MRADVELPLRAVKLGEIIATIKATPAKTNFIVFDACRDVLMSFAAKSGNKGLGREEKRAGALIAFATDPGATATDEGFYAEALADELQKPGVEAGQAFRAVRRRVLEFDREPQAAAISVLRR